MEPCNRSSTSLLLHPTRMILRGLRLLFYGDSHLRDVALSLILMLGYPESRIPHKHYSWSAVFAEHDLMITIVFASGLNYVALPDVHADTYDVAFVSTGEWFLTKFDTGWKSTIRNHTRGVESHMHFVIMCAGVPLGFRFLK
eukprot:PhF_6_TR37570/c0_g2_i16/m.55694